MRAFQIVIDRRPLRAVPPAYATLHGVVDVLVDGTNVTARIGQDHALPLLRDLAYAAADLSCGRHKRATLRFYDQRDAWALGLERVGEHVLITVFQGGATPKVAVHERAVQGDALVRGVLSAIDDVVAGSSAPPSIAADLAAARRILASTSWTPAIADEQVVDADVGHTDGQVSFSTSFKLRVQPLHASGAPDVERNDLHSLLVRGPFRFRVGEARRELAETYPFLIAEAMVREASEVLDAWEAGRAINHRMEAGGVLLTTRLTSDGNLALGFAGPRMTGARRGSTFPSVRVTAFVEAVVTFSRALVRPLLRHDRSQRNNLRMQAFREAVREVAEALREAVREDAKYNESPESYRAFASAGASSDRSVASETWGVGRLRFAPAWQATVPNIDLHATFLFGDRIVVGGAREMACIDRGSGHVVWRSQVDRGISVAAPSGVLRIGADGGLAHYEVETGELTLRAKLAARTGGMPAGAVVNAPGLPRLAVVSEGERHITAVDLVSGEVRWRHALGRGRSFKVRRAGRLLVVSSAEPTLSALDVTSGETVWRIRDRQRFCRPATYDANSLFVVTGESTPDTRQNEVLHALDPWTGVTRWKKELPAGRRTLGAPLVARESVIMVIYDHRGVGFLAYDRETALLKWTVEPGFAPATSAWLLVDDMLIVNGENSEVSALDVRTGQARWRQRYERALDTDVPRHIDPVLRSGALFVPGQTVNVVRPHDGEIIGKVPTDLVPDLVRVDERCNVIVVEESGHIAAFSAGAKLTLVKG